jgi:acyl-CoA reductase-like NAD-dependent aldehyde dehydrogenase
MMRDIGYRRLVGEVTLDMRIAQEEVFGPVLSVLRLEGILAYTNVKNVCIGLQL